MRMRESDWKVFKRIRALALERFSQRILDECREICMKQTSSAHERYLELFRLIHERDKLIAAAFDRFSRSSAYMSLRLIRSMNLLTDAEVAELSAEAQEVTDPEG
ncbi:hypothetical protein B1C78_04280 [Thioalkalivibrio denitrificans]|uniref:Peptide ABC transporter substrate-binding protein n=1 Tax=Thioalkalivibrio denitrificans TaxID=108003 RepID=A0A1V3NQG7_9GAMM|nr:hypothetical protein [Thioalkalivibrio denitrificans]OOG27203.1 hypothetical protein B1C78_04280 [Thioalkalivibrio denitrificans]